MLKVENICKKYPSFELKNVSFNIERGFITGFIGANGAGKTTTMKCITNLVKPDSGTVEMFGKDYFTNEIESKEKIGLSLGSFEYYPKTKIKKIVDVYKRFYKDWDDSVYRSYLEKFSLDENKKVSELSTGMKVKLGITLALSHNAELIIFDEPTSGLDPIARNEIVELFQEIVEDGTKSVLFSTHITSDLDKCADYIIFINNGQILFSDTKDNIMDTYYLIRGKNDVLTESLKAKVVGYKQNAFGFTALIERQLLNGENVETATPNLEELMLYFYEEEKNNDND